HLGKVSTFPDCRLCLLSPTSGVSQLGKLRNLRRVAFQAYPGTVDSLAIPTQSLVNGGHGGPFSVSGPRVVQEYTAGIDNPHKSLKHRIAPLAQLDRASDF